MESETGGLVECGVGTIVWVRRRNGSWWPGKILGSDELSASHLMSPRSGTPVKLLGREDASVDWYNLEKSKRVKPFRCGEFDDCIERAEASQGMPPKKREKYARREDAILHALDLEKQFVEKKYAKLPLHSNNNNNNCFTTKLLPKDTQSEFSCDNGKHAKLSLSLSLEDKRKALYLKEQEHEQMGSHLNVDGNSQDVRPRLRGLQDLGVAPISFNYKHSSLNGSSNKHAVDDDDGDDGDDDGVTLETMIHVGMLEKRKRSQEGNMEESMGKRRDRRRPLVQVLNSSAKLPLQLKGDGGEDRKEVVDPAAMLRDSFNYLPHQVEPKFDSFPVGLSEENNTTGSNEDTETDSSGTESLLSDTYDAMAALSDEGEDIEFIPKAFGRSVVHEEVESMSEDESGVGDESGDSLPSSVTVSKWQLKGKRNSRRYPERNMHWNSFKGGEESSFYDKNNMKSQAAMVGHDIINWEVEQQHPLSSSSLQGGVGYWVVDPPPSALYLSSSSRQFGERIKSMLIEVEVQVQSGYQREHVPMISLMSKLNDNAIVGHPISIETLEDGSSDNIILSAAADEESFLLLLGGGGGALDSTIQPWTTARRTAKCRVPRPPLLSTLEEEEEEASFDEYVVEELNRKGRKLMKKPQRKTSSSCNQKIRTLSSIGESGTHQQNMDLKSQGYKGGVMKPESLPTAVACIPVKLVFSRLHEELVARHQ